MDIKLDVLLEHPGDIAHDPRELCEHVPNGLHARLHDGVLQFRRHEVDALEAGLNPTKLRLVQNGAQLVAAEHQFACQIHQRFEQTDAYPQSSLGSNTAFLFFASRNRLGRHRTWARRRRGCDQSIDRRSWTVSGQSRKWHSHKFLRGLH